MNTNSENKNGSELFVKQLQSLWGTEQAILKLLPEMINKSTDEGLMNVLRLHFSETLNQTSALRGIFKQLGIDAGGEAPASFHDLLRDSQTALESDNPGNDSDLKIISIARNVERYEIGLYMDAIIEAGKQDFHGAEKTLLLTLNEERLAGVKLDFLKRNIEELMLQPQTESVY